MKKNDTRRTEDKKNRKSKEEVSVGVVKNLKFEIHYKNSRCKLKFDMMSM